MAGAFLGLPSGCQSDEGALDPPIPSVAERGGGVVAVSPIAHGFCCGKTARDEVAVTYLTRQGERIAYVLFGSLYTVPVP